MAKRFAVVLLITIGVALTSVIAFVMILFLAPGLSLFGVKYIAVGTHVVSENTVISEKMSGGTFSGSIRIETEDVPVEVVFSQGYNFVIDYYDNFNGLTNSKFDDPSIDFSKEADGTAVIKVISFRKFIFENNNSKRHIILKLPASVVGGTKQGQTSLTIKGKNADVSFRKEVDDNYNPYFENIEIETDGKVVSSTSVKADTYSLKTINAIKITEDESNSINAQNYNLESLGGRIVVDRNVTGDISAKTKDARIQILSCKNFTASSGFGDIYCSRADGEIIVNGKANIETTAGLVEIGSILSTSEKSSIVTKTGNIDIKKMYDADITSTRGFIKIVSGKNLVVETSSGAITVEEATDSINVKTKRGKICLGGEANVLKNPTVESSFGNIEIYSASGIVNAQTLTGDISFNNRDAVKIKLKAGRDLIATKLKGVVNIEVNGNADIDFDEFTNNSTIVGTKENSNIVVKLLKNDLTSFAYNLEAANAVLYEYNVNDTDNHYQISNSTNITSSAETVGKPLLSVENAGKLVVYCKRAS